MRLTTTSARKRLVIAIAAIAVIAVATVSIWRIGTAGGDKRGAQTLVASGTPSYSVSLATAPLTFLKLGTTFTPVADLPTVGVAASTAVANLESGLQSFQGNMAGPLKVTPYLFTNTQYANGSKYKDTPVWLVTVPLKEEVNDESRPVSQSGIYPTFSPRAGCQYLYVVDVATGQAITWWQDCPGGS